MKLSGEKYSEELTAGSNHVSVPIMMSGWVPSKRISKIINGRSRKCHNKNSAAHPKYQEEEKPPPKQKPQNYM